MTSPSAPSDTPVTPTLTNPSPSPFLNLPAELRNAIYAYALDGNYTVQYIRTKPKPYYRTSPHHIPHRFALLWTCRQIHAETVLLPFLLSQWRFETLATLRAWSETLSARQRNAMRIVHLDIDLTHPCANWEIGFPAGMRARGWNGVREIFPGVRCVRAEIAAGTLLAIELFFFRRDLVVWLDEEKGMVKRVRSADEMTVVEEICVEYERGSGDGEDVESREACGIYGQR